MTFDRQFEDEERVMQDIATYGRDALEVTARAGLRPHHFCDTFHRRLYTSGLNEPGDFATLVRRLASQEATTVAELVDWDAQPFNDAIAADIAHRSSRIMLKGHEPALSAPKLRSAPLLDDVDRYGEVALQRISDDLRHAASGGRNRALNTAAFSAAKLVRDGHASEQSVAYLMDIAADLGLPSREVRATWRSGWNAGWAA